MIVKLVPPPNCLGTRNKIKLQDAMEKTEKYITYFRLQKLFALHFFYFCLIGGLQSLHHEGDTNHKNRFKNKQNPRDIINKPLFDFRNWTLMFSSWATDRLQHSIHGRCSRTKVHESSRHTQVGGWEIDSDLISLSLSLSFEVRRPDTLSARPSFSAAICCNRIFICSS